MEIRDVIHGSITIDSAELPIIDSRMFQRLRQIKQLGFAEHSFPSATHNRYIHSLGAMATATRAFDSIFRGSRPLLKPESATRLRQVTRLGALLHDIGHGPLSHTTEFAMPKVADLKLTVGAGARGKGRIANHEDYTLKMILDSSLTPAIERVGAVHGFTPLHVAALIDPEIELPAGKGEDFFTETLDGVRTDFRPILKQLISSELDADRMDYLRRDSLHAGVSYGQFDFDWLVTNLTHRVVPESSGHAKCYLALEHRALYSFEDFLISRFHMFLMVYFHYKSVVFDSMLQQYLEGPESTYSLPSDIEKYAECDDAHLYGHLAKSTNIWAKRIVERRPYRMLVELHSGIPATKTAASEQELLLKNIVADCKARNVHYLEKTSTGELSKYFRKPGDPIFVRYDNHYSEANFIPLEQCTDLFRRYGEKRSITRLYVAPESLSEFRRRGKGAPLNFSDSAADSGITSI